jgi:hypothetical protein
MGGMGAMGGMVMGAGDAGGGSAFTDRKRREARALQDAKRFWEGVAYGGWVFFRTSRVGQNLLTSIPTRVTRLAQGW